MTILRWTITVLALYLLVSPQAHAAYTTATITANEIQTSGASRLVFRFTGNAGEPAVIREYVVNANSTATTLQNWVNAVLNELNLMRTAATLPALQAGRTVAPLAPTPSTPTAKDIWLNKVDRYRAFSGLGLTGTAATDLAALQADINATYVTGYLQ